MSAAQTITEAPSTQRESERAATEKNCAMFLGASGRITAITSALVLFSVILIASAAAAGGGEPRFFDFVIHRLNWIAVSIPAFLLGRFVPYKFWRKYSTILLITGTLTLLLVLLPNVGTSISGARRWIRLGPGIGFQPSQLIKPVLLIWLASWCHRWNKHGLGTMKNFKYGLLIPGTIIGVICVLILMEPDFGTASLLALVGVTVLVVSGASFIQAGLCALATAPLIHLLIVNYPYRMRRITVFLNPMEDVRDSGYQLIQSLAAIASGGIYGKGPGEVGIAYLPAAANDFIFSVITRQYGLIGAIIVIILFGWLLWEGLKVALRSPDTFGFSLAFGITLLICLQAAIHIAVTAGAAPTTGITMPLVSAGGSSLFFTLWAIGILCNIAVTTSEKSYA